MWNTVVVFQTRERDFIIVPPVGHTANELLAKVGYKQRLLLFLCDMALTEHCCRGNRVRCRLIIPSDIVKVSLVGVCSGREPRSEGLQ